ncbi:CoA transferase [Geobacter argillaceus]|uniref:Crotonobetainyl-CoA:carnitine CoA-transferase CaiB-like acyl-CoA transferase n=1 Tax=Geobacter argillaceus TaxID=345631 RepID=A0A562WUT6_9BACT|nr:CoA transferase [Geobacter argillaceus]TWJ33429.1 crotonobetainyl-CoA:carnitine CoA-transferase CaiB-like acyl-CoA transferase [Geobacter argillaceus]
MEYIDGIRVLNLAVNLPGPAAARKLQQFGATVTKVEPPSGDPLEQYHAGWYRDMAKGQTIVTIDLKMAEGHARLDELLAGTDLLITATRPAALERLGLGWAELHQKYPRLCQVAIVGYPSPRQNEAGHDLTYQATLGLLNPPHMPRTLMADMAGADQTVGRALALLLARELGNGSGYAEIALSEAAAEMAEPLTYGTTMRGALLGGGIPEYNVYATSEGWVAVAALEPHFKMRLEESLGVRTIEEYRTAFGQMNADYWQEWGREKDVPIVVVQ